MDTALIAINFFFQNKKVKFNLKKWNGSNNHRIKFKSVVRNGGGIFISFIPATYPNCPLLIYTFSDSTNVPNNKIVCDLVMETYQKSEEDDIYTTKLCIRCLVRTPMVEEIILYTPVYQYVPLFKKRFPVVNTSLSLREMTDHLYCSLNTQVDMDFAIASAFAYIDRYSVVYQVNSDNQLAVFCATVVLAVSMQAEIGQITVPMLAQLVGCMEWEQLFEFALHIMETLGWHL